MTADGEYTLYVFWVSYYGGKMQAYLRYKEVPHRAVEPSWWELASAIYPATGLMKLPVVRTPDGEWLQDSTPMIDWFEQRFPAGPVLPDDPYQAFFCRLLEDYADEWLWRPAMHYRWSYPISAHSLSRRFAETFLSSMPGPKWLKAMYARHRQKSIFVNGDGVTPETRGHVESIYLSTLDRLETILRAQPFLLGGKPTLADFGFFASMFRHFCLDPAPSLLMQERAPAVFEWVARLWNTRHSSVRGEWLAPGTLPEGAGPILKDIGEAYLPYLHANARAWRDGRDHFDLEIQGVHYRRLPVVQYRVYCRERLQDSWDELPATARPHVEATLVANGCLEPLLRDGRIESHLHHGTPPVCQPQNVSLRKKAALFWAGTPWGAQGPPLRRR